MTDGWRRVVAAALFVGLATTGCGSSDDPAPPQSSVDTQTIADTGVDISEATDGLDVDAPTDIPQIPDVPAGADASDADEAEVTEAETETSDTTSPGPDAGPPVGDGSVGAACFKDDQCDGDEALCLDWNDGYCTSIGCPALGACPSGSSCIEFGGQTTICVDECTTQDDCRLGYGCKPIDDVDGTPIMACVTLDDGAAVLGGPCESATDCEGSLTCLDFVPDGYCAQTGCSESTDCPDASICVTFNGTPTCLKACEELADCLVDGATKRICGPLLDIAGDVQSVCIPNGGGVGVGSECTTDIECDSNECRILAEGKCVSSELGCFTDADCPDAGVCELAPAYVVGVCTQACGTGVSCPGTSKCVLDPGFEAWCQVPCSGFNDVNTCESNLGETCVFGDPVGDATGGGTYACIIQKTGDPGMQCASEADCKAPGCIGGPAGTCAPSCSETLKCPYPTTCVEHESELRCMKRCFSVADCPGTMKCQSTLTSPSKICVPGA